MGRHELCDETSCRKGPDTTFADMPSSSERREENPREGSIKIDFPSESQDFDYPNELLS